MIFCSSQNFTLVKDVSSEPTAQVPDLVFFDSESGNGHCTMLRMIPVGTCGMSREVLSDKVQKCLEICHKYSDVLPSTIEAEQPKPLQR